MSRRGTSGLSKDRAGWSAGEWGTIFGCFLVIGIGLGAWVFGASVEASTYNRFTDGDATTWEAMWTNFRVDCN